MSDKLKTQEELISSAFIESLLQSSKTKEDTEARQYLIKYVVPCLVPAIASLLQAEERNQKKLFRGEDVIPIQPMNYLAKYLYRYNPRHNPANKETKALEELSDRILDASTRK